MNVNANNIPINEKLFLKLIKILKDNIQGPLLCLFYETIWCFRAKLPYDTAIFKIWESVCCIQGYSFSEWSPSTFLSLRTFVFLYTFLKMFCMCFSKFNLLSNVTHHKVTVYVACITIPMNDISLFCKLDPKSVNCNFAGLATSRLRSNRDIVLLRSCWSLSITPVSMQVFLLVLRKVFYKCDCRENYITNEWKSNTYSKNGLKNM